LARSVASSQVFLKALWDFFLYRAANFAGRGRPWVFSSSLPSIISSKRVFPRTTTPTLVILDGIGMSWQPPG
jgi:hypothetical protein